MADPADAPANAAEAIARVSLLSDRLAALERAFVELQVWRRKTEQTAPAAALAPGASPELGPLKAELEAARAKASAEERAAAQARLELAASVEKIKLLEAARDQAAAAPPDDAAHRAEIERLKKDVERIEGEYQALKIVHEERVKKLESGIGALDLASLSADPKVQETLKKLVAEREKAVDEKTKAEAELAKIKVEATRTIKQLKADLEKRGHEAETVKLQKDNLMKQLQSRDSGGAGHELTLEEITNSEVFKNMLGNVRRTSRLEVTHLHDAIAQLKDVDPKSYNLCLDMVAKQFKKAQMENPLALLQKG